MLIVALVVIAVFVMALKSATPQAPSPMPAPTDFNGTSTELNGVDLDKIDNGLNELNIQTSTF